MPSWKFQDDEQKPKLKLEVIRGGRGPGGRTAIGTRDRDDEPDWETEEAPRWFNFIFPLVRFRVRAYVRSMEVEERSVFFRRARINRVDRVLLCGRWQLLTLESLRREEARSILEIWQMAPVMIQDRVIPRFLDELEKSVVWNIWSFMERGKPTVYDKS